MHAFPHTECPTIEAAFAGLVGLNVARGYTREVQTRFGGPRGCTHLEHLARSLGPVVIQAVTSRRALSVSRGESEDLLAEAGGTRQPVGTGLVPHLGRGTDRRPEAGRRVATGNGAVPLPRPGDLPRPVGRMTVRGRAMAATAVLAMAVLVAACSNGTSVRSPFSTTPPVLHSGPEYEITTGHVDGLGTVLVDGQGLTIYMFDNDVRGEPSRCYDICAVEWPPVVLKPGVTQPVAGPGIDAGAARHVTAYRRHHPGHLQRLAALPVAAGPGPG